MSGVFAFEAALATARPASFVRSAAVSAIDPFDAGCDRFGFARCLVCELRCFVCAGLLGRGALRARPVAARG
jgi:hypothetical protein